MVTTACTIQIQRNPTSDNYERKKTPQKNRGGKGKEMRVKHFWVLLTARRLDQIECIWGEGLLSAAHRYARGEEEAVIQYVWGRTVQLTFYSTGRREGTMFGSIVLPQSVHCQLVSGIHQ